MLAIIVAISPLTFSSSKGSLLAHWWLDSTNKEPCKKVATSNHVQQMREGTHWQSLAELTWSSTSDIPQRSWTKKQCPHDWIALNQQPNHDQLHNLGRMERNGISDHCNFPSTKKAPSFCSPCSSLQIFLVNQKLKVPSCQLWSVEILLWVWYVLSRYTKK